MKRSVVQALAEKVWGEPIDGDPLRVAVVPANAGVMGELFSLSSDAGIMAVCERVFVAFENYTEDDGAEVPNTLDARMELFRVLAVRRWVINTTREVNDNATMGESDAGGD